jgi:hypothetical protein
MTPAEAKRIVQAAEWQLNPPVPYHPQFPYTSQTGDKIPESLQTCSPGITQEIFTALGINIADSFQYGHSGVQGGHGHWVFGNAIRIIADAGANFPEKNRFLSGRKVG